MTIATIETMTESTEYTFWDIDRLLRRLIRFEQAIATDEARRKIGAATDPDMEKIRPHIKALNDELEKRMLDIPSADLYEALDGTISIILK